MTNYETKKEERFEVTVITEGDFLIEAWLRAHDEDARITRNGNMHAWLTLEEIEEVKKFGYTVIVW